MLCVTPTTVGAFSSPSASITVHSCQNSNKIAINSINPLSSRTQSQSNIFTSPATRTRTNTRLHEQPVNVKNILGPISPSTLAKYNLQPEIINNAWSAQVVTKTAKSTNNNARDQSNILGKVSTDVQLIPKNPNEHFVGNVRIEIPIPLGAPGLGIELLEIEGGRTDGLGIVIVNGLVTGGNAERAVEQSKQLNGPSQEGEIIMKGDTIVSADLILERTNGLGNIDVTSIKTECMNYESTVEALVGMLGAITDDEKKNIKDNAKVMLTLKRIRRRPKIQVTLHYPPSQDLPSETLTLQPGDNLRMVMLQRGIKLNDPIAQRYDGKAANGGNCGGGALCRTCAVSVLRGGEFMSPPKESETKMMDGTMLGGSVRGRLACKSWVGYGMKEGEIVIQVNPRQW